MKRTDFNFEYPEELVAQSPLAERDRARLLFWNGHKDLKQDRNFSELPAILREKYPQSKFESILLIVNDSKVFPARMRCKRKSGGRAEVFVLSTQAENDIPCLLRPQKKLRVGEVLFSEESARPAFEIQSLEPPRVKNISGVPLLELLGADGEMPLPPYIERDPEKIFDPSLAALDRLRYQTVYAKDLGSAAAPTAGLHFTPNVLTECDQLGIKLAPVTLHVGLGTFQPVTTEVIEDHKMHNEICYIPSSTMNLLIEHIENSWPIFFVGTTSLRCVESILLKAEGLEVSKAGGQSRLPLSASWKLRQNEIKEKLNAVAENWHETNLFVRPTSENLIYRPLCGDGIITNFHQPESTLAMLIASLLGYSAWQNLYQHAVTEKYRLFSYGDSSLLLFPDAK